MKFSIITVCFNSADTLRKTLQSVAAQDWADIEHIIIDGASTDGTRDILEESRELLAHIVSEPDRGIYDAMNKGLDWAKGDVICFLNADDYYSSYNIISRVAEEFKDCALDALIGDVGFFKKANPECIVRRYRSDRFQPERLVWGWMPAHPALFLRREVVKRVGYFKSDYKIAGDFEFVLRAFYGQNLQYKHLPEILVRMQIGGVSTSGLRSKILLNKEMLRACRENGLSTNIFKLLSRYPVKMAELLTLDKSRLTEKL